MTNEPNNSVNYITHITNPRDVGVIIIGICIVCQVIMLNLNQLYKLNFEIAPLYYPTIILAVFFLAPLLTTAVKKQ